MWLALAALVVVTILGVAGEVLLQRAGPILKGRVIETLSTRFNGRVELDGFDVSLMHGLEVSGDGLRVYPPDDVVAAGATRPLISLRHFAFHAGLHGLYIKPMHVDTVRVSGMEIHIPPRSARQAQAKGEKKRSGKIEIVVERLVFDDSRLVIDTDKANKDPKDFELRHIVMEHVGGEEPWSYDATLRNAIPRGEIHAVGAFGPWRTESPGDSAVTGRYEFDHADLGTIRGIGGTLHSTGEFGGRLNRIEVEGMSETPDFSLDTAKHPMRLTTKFHAVVDGTTGDTYLQAVEARLGESEFTCHGEVVNIKGVGHRTSLDLDVPNGRIEDFLELAVKTQPTVMTGRVEMKTTVEVRPGKESVSRKIGLEGEFTLRQVRFTNPKVEDKVDMLSLRAEGDPQDAKPGAADVRSKMVGQFSMQDGRLSFRELDYQIPGAEVALTGVYSLDGEQFEFAGDVRTKAKLSQMVVKGWKSTLLKLADPFFARDGAGAVIPVKISGTKGAPRFGLDFGKIGR